MSGKRGCQQVLCSEDGFLPGKVARGKAKFGIRCLNLPVVIHRSQVIALIQITGKSH